MRDAFVAMANAPPWVEQSVQKDDHPLIRAPDNALFEIFRFHEDKKSSSP